MAPDVKAREHARQRMISQEIEIERTPESHFEKCASFILTRAILYVLPLAFVLPFCGDNILCVSLEGLL